MGCGGESYLLVLLHAELELAKKQASSTVTSTEVHTLYERNNMSIATAAGLIK